MPVLVIHGEQDPIIRPKGGRSTARAIPGARLVTYPGMGHDLPRALWPAILEEISALAAQAEQARPGRPAGLQLDADWIGDAASRNHIRRFTAPNAAARMVRPPGPGA